MKSLWQYMIATLQSLSKSAYSVQYNIILTWYAQVFHSSGEKKILFSCSSHTCSVNYLITEPVVRGCAAVAKLSH